MLVGLKEFGKIHNSEAMELSVQAVAAVITVIALAAHVTEVRATYLVASVCRWQSSSLRAVGLQVGFVGLAITVIVTAFNGVTEEHHVRCTPRLGSVRHVD